MTSLHHGHVTSDQPIDSISVRLEQFDLKAFLAGWRRAGVTGKLERNDFRVAHYLIEIGRPVAGGYLVLLMPDDATISEEADVGKARGPRDARQRLEELGVLRESRKGLPGFYELLPEPGWHIPADEQHELFDIRLTEPGMSADSRGDRTSGPGAPAPNRGAVTPNFGAGAPNSGAVAQNLGAPAPGDSGATAPSRGAVAPNFGAPAPNSGAVAQNLGAPAPGNTPSQVPASTRSKDDLTTTTDDDVVVGDVREALQAAGCLVSTAIERTIEQAPDGLTADAVAWCVAEVRRRWPKQPLDHPRLVLKLVRDGDWQAGLAEARERRLRAEDARRRSEAAQRQREADARESSQSWAEIDATIDTADADALAEAHRRAIEQAPTPHAAKAWKQADPRAADAPRGLRTLIVHHLTATGAEAPGHTEAAPQGLGGRSTTDAPSAGQEAPPAVCADRPPRDDAGAGKTS